MPWRHIAVVQKDRTSAERLAGALHQHFAHVTTAADVEELRTAIPKQRINVAVLDLDAVKLEDIRLLRAESGVQIVCTHHLPDEAMWAAALAAGAVDCCYDDDTSAIVAAARGHRIGAAA